MTEKGITWFEFPKPPARNRVAAWLRRCGLDDDGNFWVPAGLSGGEKEVFLCASFDGEPIVMDGGHYYVRATWLGREFRELAPMLAAVRENIEKAARPAEGPA